jgi:hypothetical protein
MTKIDMGDTAKRCLMWDDGERRLPIRSLKLTPHSKMASGFVDKWALVGVSKVGGKKVEVAIAVVYSDKVAK